MANAAEALTTTPPLESVSIPAPPYRTGWPGPPKNCKPGPYGIGQKGWEQHGTMLATKMRNAGSATSKLAWQLGDWMNYGQWAWDLTGDGSFAGIAEKIGIARETLYQYSSVAHRVDRCIRIQQLSWAHHQLVAVFHKNPDAQRQWLQLAVDQKLSVHKLAEAIQQERNKAKAVKAPQQRAIITFSPDTFSALSTLAEASNSTVAELVIQLVQEHLAKPETGIAMQAAKDTIARRAASRPFLSGDLGDRWKQRQQAIDRLCESHPDADAGQIVRLYQRTIGEQFPFSFACKHTDFAELISPDITAEDCCAGVFSGTELEEDLNFYTQQRLVDLVEVP